MRNVSEKHLRLLLAGAEFVNGTQRDGWGTNLQALVTFMENNGKLPRQRSKHREERRMGNWCALQRKRHKRGDLSDEKVGALNSHPWWQWDSRKTGDLEWIEILCRIDVLGRLPSRYSKDEGERFLGKWCSRQRTRHKGGVLSPRRTSLLETRGWWKWDDGIDWDAHLEMMCARIKDFASKEGRLPAISGPEDEADMMKWIYEQKRKQSNGRLSRKRADALRDVEIELRGMGIASQQPYRDGWHKDFKLVRVFVREHAKFPSRCSKDSEEKRMGNWCHTQRKAFKGQDGRKIIRERVKLLESIPGWYWSK